MALAKSIENAIYPCDHYARAGLRHILATPGVVTDDDCVRIADAEDDPQSFKISDAIHEAAALRWMLAATLDGGRKKGEEIDHARPIRWGGVQIDWHIWLPELRVWAGQQTIGSIMDSRIEAIKAAVAESDTPELPAPLLEWTVPLTGASGLDCRTVPIAIDVGFAPGKLGMHIMSFAAAELLMIVGLQVAPITRNAPRCYSHLDARQNWIRWNIETRGGEYGRMIGRGRLCDILIPAKS